MDNLTKGALGATILLMVGAMAFAVSNASKNKDLEADKIALQQQLQAGNKQRADNELAAMARRMDDNQRKSEEQLAALRREMATTAATSSAEFQIQEAERLALQVTIAEKVRMEDDALEQTLNPLQKKIRDATAVGKVTHVNQDLGFVVIGAGSAGGIQEGARFNIRRKMFIVAEIEISSVENERESVANIDLSKLSPGLTIKPGDEVIGHPIY
jgi:hypothetical protein